MPEPKSKSLDFSALILDGRNLADINDASMTSGYPVVLPSKEAILESRPELQELQKNNPEGFDKLINNIENAYKVYKDDQYIKTKTSVKLAPNTAYFNAMLPESAIKKYREYSPTPSSKTGMQGAFGVGFVQTTHEDEVTSSLEYFEDKEGFNIPLQYADKGNFNHLVRVHGDITKGEPEFKWKELQDNELAYGQDIRTWAGDRSLDSSWYSSIGRGLWGGTVPLTAKGIGQFVDVIGDIGNQIYNEKHGWLSGEAVEGWSDRFGNSLTNWGNYTTHQNKDEQMSWGDSWSSLLYNVASGVGQVGGMVAMAATTGGLGSLAGLGNIANSASWISSLSLGSMQAAGAFREEMNKLGIDDAESARWYFPFFAATFASESLIGPNVLTHFYGKEAGKMVRESVQSLSSKVLKETGKKIKDLSEQEKKIYIKELWEGMSNKMKQFNEIAMQSRAGRFAVAGFEEFREEEVEGIMDYGIQSIYNGIAQKQSEILLEKYDGYEWKEENGKYFRISPYGLKEQIDKSIYDAEIKDVTNAKKVKNGEKLFDPHYSFGEEGFIAFLSAGLVGGVFNTHQAKKKKEQEDYLIDMVFEATKSPGSEVKSINKLVNEIDKMKSEGLTPEDYIDITGKPVAYGTDQKSKFDIYKEQIVNDFTRYIDIAKKYNLDKETLKNVIGNDKPLLRDALKTASDIDLLTNAITESESGKINPVEGLIEGNETKEQLQSKIKEKQTEFDYITKPEPNSKFSRAYNFKQKEVSLPFLAAEKKVNDYYKSQNITLTPKILNSNTYRNAINNVLNEMPVNLYFEIQRFNKGFEPYLQRKKEEIEVLKAKRETDIGNVKEAIRGITVNPKDIQASIDNVIQGLNKIKYAGGINMADDLVKEFGDIYNTTYNTLTGLTQKDIQTAEETMMLSAEGQTLTPEQQEIMQRGSEYQSRLENIEALKKEIVETPVEQIEDREVENPYVNYFTDDINKITKTLQLAKQNNFVGLNSKEISTSVSNTIKDIDLLQAISYANNQLLTDKRLQQHISPDDRVLNDNEYKTIKDNLDQSKIELENIQEDIKRLEGSRATYQDRIRQTISERSRLSIKFIIDTLGDKLLKSVPEIVDIYKEIKSVKESLKKENIDKLLNETEINILEANERAINKIEALLYQNRNIIFSKDNLDVLLKDNLIKQHSQNDFVNFYANAKEHSFGNYIENIIGQTDEKNFLKGDVGYVYFINWLSKINNINSNTITKKIIDDLKNTDQPTLTPEQQYTISQVVSFLDGNGSDIYRRILNYETELDKEKGIKRTEEPDALKYYIPNSITVLGEYGTGKTSMVGKFIKYSNNQHDVKLVGHTSSIRSELNKSLKDVSKKSVSSHDINDILNGSIKFKNTDTIIWDEASLLTNKDILSLKKILNDSGNPKIIFLGDIFQMQQFTQRQEVVFASKTGIRTMPFTSKFSNDIPLIQALTERYKSEVFQSNTNPFPKVFSKITDNEKIGAKYYSNDKDVINDFILSKSTNKALIVLNNEHFEQLKKDYPQLIEEHFDKEKNIYKLEYLRNENNELVPESIQGLRKNEIYIAIDINNLNDYKGTRNVNNSTKGRVGYTSVSRARNFVGLIGDAKNGNANNENEVLWRENKNVQQNSLYRSAEEERSRLEGIIYDNNIDFEPETNESKDDIEIKSFDDLTKKQKDTNTKTKGKKVDNEEVTRPEIKFEETNEQVYTLKDNDGKLLSANNNYINKESGNIFKIDNFEKRDLNGITDYRININNEQLSIEQFNNKYDRFDEVLYEEENNLQSIKYKQSGGKVWGTSYSVIFPEGITLLDNDIEKIRAISPILLINDNLFNKKLVYIQSAEMLNNDNIQTTFNDVLAVEITPKDIKQFNSFLKNYESKNKKVKDAIDDIINNGFDKYKYLMSLSRTESTDNNGKIVKEDIDYSDPTEYKELIDRINTSFGIDDYSSGKRELNKGLVELRKYGKTQYNSTKQNITVLGDIASIQDKKEGRVIYSDEFIKGKEFISRIKEKGVNFDDNFESLTIKGNTVYGIRYSYEGDVKSTSPVLIMEMPKISEFKKDEFRKFINNDDIILNGIKNSDTKNSFNTKIKETNLYQLIANNQFNITKNKDLNKFFSRYIKFVGNAVRFDEKGQVGTEIRNGLLTTKKYTKEGIDENKSVVEKLIYKKLKEDILSADDNLQLQINTLSQPGFINFKVTGKYILTDETTEKLVTRATDIYTPYGFIYTGDILSNLQKKTNTQNSSTKKDKTDRFNDGLYNILANKKDYTESNKIQYESIEKVNEQITNVLGKDFLENKTEFHTALKRNGIELFGLVENGTIKLELTEKGIEETTTRHEIFHVIFNYALSDETKQKLLTEAKNNMNKTDASNIEAEDYMAKQYGARKQREGLLGRFFRFLEYIYNRYIKAQPEITKLMQQMDSGIYADTINPPFNDDITREHRKFDPEEYNELINTFARPERITAIKKLVSYKINQFSDFSLDKEQTSANIFEAINDVRDMFASDNIKDLGNIETKRGTIETLTSKDIPYITDEQRKQYELFQLSKEDIFDLVVKSAFPDVNIDNNKLRKKTQSTQYEKSKDFNPVESISGMIRWQLSIIPYRVFNGTELEQWDGTSFVGVTDLENSLNSAAQEASKIYNEKGGDYSRIFYTRLHALAKNVGENNTKSNNIYSFLSKFNGFQGEPSIRSIVDDLESKSYLNQAEFDRMIRLTNFLNALTNTYKSLGIKNYAMMEIDIKFEKDNIYKLKKISPNDYNEESNNLVNNITSKIYDGTGSINQSTKEKLIGNNKKFEVTNTGLSWTEGKLTKIINISGGKVSFTNDFTLEHLSKIKSFFGMNNLRTKTLTSLFDGTSSGALKLLQNKTNAGLNTTEELKDFLAEALMNMFWSTQSNINTLEEISSLNMKLDDGDITKEEYDKLVNGVKNNYRFKEEMSRFRNKMFINESTMNGQKELVSEITQTNDIKIPKPTDYYNFFDVLGLLNKFFKGNNANNRTFISDGTTRYNFGLKSKLDDIASNGTSYLSNKFRNKIETNQLELLKESPFASDINGKIVYHNQILDPNDGMQLIKLYEYSGIKYISGTTEPNIYDLTNMNINAFLEGLNNKIESLNFLLPGNKNILAEFTIDTTGRSRLVHGIEGDNYKYTTINNALINKGIDKQFETIKKKHDISINTWINTIKELKLPLKDFERVAKDKENTPTDIVNYFNSNTSKLKNFIPQIQKSNLRENVDYILDKEGNISLGKDASFNINNNEEDIYTYDNYKLWNETTDYNNKIELRDKLFLPLYFKYSDKLSESGYKVPEKLRILPGGYIYYNSNTKEWNPIFKAHFYSYHITMNALNPFTIGTISDFKDSVEKFKRIGPTNTGGSSLNFTSKYGLLEDAKVIIVKDLSISDPIINTKVELANGQMWGSMLYKRFFDISAGGSEYGPYDNTMMKTLYNNTDIVTGKTHQIKHANDFTTGDLFANSTFLRELEKQMLKAVDKTVKKENPDYDISIYDKFIQLYEATGAVGYRNAGIAMDQLHKWIVEESGWNDQIRKNLIWGMQNISGSKIANSRINDYNPSIHPEYDFALTDINNNGVKIILNPFQDIYDIEKAIPMNQIFGYVGVGSEENRRSAKVINEALDKIVKLGQAKIDAEINNQPYDNTLIDPEDILADKTNNFLRQRGIASIDKMSNNSSYAEILNNKNITIDIPAVRTKLMQAYRSYITRQCIKVPFSGVRLNQVSGTVIPIFEKDGKPYILRDIERNLGKEINHNEEIGGDYTIRSLKPMTPSEKETERGEVLLPFSYAKEFGILEGETLADIFTIKLIDGTIFDMQNDLSGTIAQTIIDNVNANGIDAVQSPILRNTLRIEGNTRIVPKVEQIQSYVDTLRESLEYYLYRIPADRIGSGAIMKVIGFINDAGNNAYIPVEMTIENNSDFDMDQLSSYFKTIKNGNIVKDDTTIEGLHNIILDEINKVYKDKNNQSSIFFKSEIDEIEKLADEKQKDIKYYEDNQVATSLNQYEVNKAGDDAIGILASALGAYSHLAQLKNIIPQIAPGFTSILTNIDNNDKTSTLTSLGNWLQTALDNSKNLILGRLNISADAINIVSAMIISNKTNEEIAEFFDNKTIQAIYKRYDKGNSVENSRKNYLLFDIINEYKNDTDLLTPSEVVIKSKRIEEIDQDTAYTQSEKGQKERTRLVNELDSAIDKEKITELYNYAIKAEALRRLSHFIAIRNGMEAIDFKFEKFIIDSQQYLGTSLDNYYSGKKVSNDKRISNHIKYFKENNNDYIRETDQTKLDDMIGVEREIASQLNLQEVLNNLPYFKSSLELYKKQQDWMSDFWLINNKVIEEFKELYLKGQLKKNFNYTANRSTFYNGIGEFILDTWYKKAFKKKVFNIATSDPKQSSYAKQKIVNDIDREMWLAQFPNFIQMLKDASTSTKKTGQQILSEVSNDYKLWYDSIKNNKLLNNIIVTGRYGVQYLELQDATNLTENSIVELSNAFKLLPEELQLMLSLNQFIQYGFQYRKGTMADIIGTNIYLGENGLSNHIKELKEDMINNPSKYKKIGKKFKKYIEHQEGMSQYLNIEDRNKNILPNTIQDNIKSGSMIIPGVKRYDNINNIYSPEFIYGARGGFDSDIKIDNTTTEEVIKNFTAEELDKVKYASDNNIPVHITKSYISNHNYINGNLYRLSNGEVVKAEVLNSTQVRFNKPGKVEVKKSLPLEQLNNTVKNNTDVKAFQNYLDILRDRYSNINIIEETTETTRALGINEDRKGWIDSDGVHINVDLATSDTPIHEFVHIWNQIIKKEDPDLYKEMQSHAQNMIDQGHPIATIIAKTYGNFESNEDYLDEVMATVAGFTSNDTIEDWVIKNNVSTDKNFIQKIWDSVKGIIQKISEFFKFGRSVITADYTKDKLADIYRNIIANPINIDKEIYRSAIGEVKRSIPLSNITQINTISDFIPIFNNNSGDQKSLDQLNNEQLTTWIFNTMKDKREKDDYKINFAGQSFQYPSDISDEKLRNNIKTDIVSRHNIEEEKIQEKTVSFIKLINEGTEVPMAANNVFGEGRYTDHALSKLIRYTNANSKVVGVFQYSDLKDNPIEALAKLYNKEFEGYNPIIIVHNIEGDGTVDLSIINTTLKPLGQPQRFVKGNGLLSNVQNTINFYNEGGTLSNKDGDIRKALLGMTIMNMKKNGKIALRNIGVLGLKYNDIDTWMVSDVNELMKNINLLKEQSDIMNVVNNDNIKQVLNDKSLYTKTYNQSFSAKVKLYLSELSDNRDVSDYERYRAKEQKNVLVGENVSRSDMERVYKKMLRDLENKYGVGNNDLYNDEEYRLVSGALFELESPEGFINKLRDSSIIGRTLVNMYNVESDLATMIIERGGIAKMKIIDEYIKYQNKVNPQFVDAVKRYYERNGLSVVSDKLKDSGSLYFEHLRKKIMVKDDSGIEHEVNSDQLHWTLEDKDTKELFDKGKITKEDLDFVNYLLNILEERWIDNTYHSMLREFKNVDPTGKSKITRGEAKRKFYGMYKRGTIPVITKSINELVTTGKFRDAFTKFGTQLGNVEILFDDNDVIGASEHLNKVSAILDRQIYDTNRFDKLGLYRDALGNIRVKDLHLNSITSNNLENIWNYFMLEGIRKEIYENEVIPIYNAANSMFIWLESFGNKQKNNKELVRRFYERLVHRKLQDEKQIFNVLGQPVDVSKLARGVLAVTQFAALAYRPTIGMKSVVFNFTSTFINSLSASLANYSKQTGVSENTLPGVKELEKAQRLFVTDYKKMLALANKYQIINRTERDLLEIPMLNVTKKRLTQEYYEQITNRMTDNAARMIGMTMVMLKDGTWDAHTFNKETGDADYDYKKDKRYYNTDGTIKGEEAKALVRDMKIRLESDGTQNKGEEGPSRAYDYRLSLDKLKWFGDKFIIGGMTELDKNTLGDTYGGAFLNQFRTFSWNRLWNLGLFAGTRKTRKGMGYVAYQDVDGEWKTKQDIREIEGIIQSFGKAYKALLNVNKEGLGTWYGKQGEITRMNLAKAAVQTVTYALLLGMIKGLVDDDDDEKRWAWMYGDVLIALTASEFFNNPIPSVNIITDFAQVMVGEKNVTKILRIGDIGKGIEYLTEKGIEE